MLEPDLWPMWKCISKADFHMVLPSVFTRSLQFTHIIVIFAMDTLLQLVKASAQLIFSCGQDSCATI